MTNGTAALADTIAAMVAAGRAAYDADQPAAPAASAAVRDAIGNAAVGDPNTLAIMRAFSRGYAARATEAADALLADLGDDEPDREPTADQERAWDAREEWIRGGE